MTIVVSQGTQMESDIRQVGAGCTIYLQSKMRPGQRLRNGIIAAPG